jgi:hypothetical protein
MLKRHRDCLLRTFDIALLEEHMGEGIPAISVRWVQLDLTSATIYAFVKVLLSRFFVCRQEI